MFRIDLKSSIATVAVIAGVLAAAGPASASSSLPTSANHEPKSAGFKSLSGMDSETEFMDYTDDALFD